MADVKKAYINYGYPYARFADTVKDIENVVLENKGVEIKPLGKEDYFIENGFDHKFYNLKNRGTVYLRSEGDWKESEGRRVSSIYAEIYDSEESLYSEVKDILLKSKEKLMPHEKSRLEEKFD